MKREPDGARFRHHVAYFSAPMKWSYPEVRDDGPGEKEHGRERDACEIDRREPAACELPRRAHPVSIGRQILSVY
jgi:hypothetical protein